MRSPPFSSRNAPSSPIVVSVPHAGRYYAPWEHQLRLTPVQLRTLEDPMVDSLVASVADTTVIVSHVPRAIIDLNRESSDIDPALIAGAVATAHPSARARAGLGVIPSRVATHGAVWRERLPAAEFTARLNTIHTPYHSALGDALANARSVHGRALLIDLHSMPRTSTDADVVLGDRFGRSASPRVADLVEQSLIGEGMTVVRNAPYAGGAIVTRHGAPANGIHAVQIELNRRLYLGTDDYTPTASISVISGMVSRVIATLADSLAHGVSVAAE